MKVLFLLLFGVTGSVLAGESLPLLAGLGKNDTVKIDYESSGCFHYVHYMFETNQSGKLEITSLGSNRNGPAENKKMPTLSMSRVEVKEMDALIKFYRSKPAGACTTTDNISFIWLRGGHELKETFTDSTCTQNLFSKLTRTFEEKDAR